MNAEETIAELESLYPKGKIIRLPQEKPKEIICEIEPASSNPNKSLAVAVIDESARHFHFLAEETYIVEKGTLTLHVGEEKYTLSVGESFKIPPKIIHWAEGDATWVKVVSSPAWTSEDHILV